MTHMDVGDDERLASVIDAAARGDEVLLTRHGKVVAQIKSTRSARQSARDAFDMKRLERLRASIRLLPGDGVEIVRQMRDEQDG